MKSRWLAATVLVIAAACGGKREQPPATAQPATGIPAEAPGLKARPTSERQTPSATPTPSPAKTPAQTVTVTPVDFERLTAFLPAFPGWTRGLVRGEHVSVGIEISKAEAQYEMGDSVIDLEVIDSGLNPIVLMPKTMFMGPGYAESFPEGYRKAVTIGGFPASESWDGDWRRAEVVVVVAKRFIVQATGHTVDNTDAVRALVTAVNLAGVAALK